MSNDRFYTGSKIRPNNFADKELKSIKDKRRGGSFPRKDDEPPKEIDGKKDTWTTKKVVDEHGVDQYVVENKDEK